MTYCVGIRLNAGLVFLSDSRTNAGLDQFSTFRKMMIYERPGDRFMVLLSAGSETLVDKGKSMMKYSLLGIVFVLSAYLLVILREPRAVERALASEI